MSNPPFGVPGRPFHPPTLGVAVIEPPTAEYLAIAAKWQRRHAYLRRNLNRGGGK